MDYARLRHTDYDWYRDGEEIVQLIEDLLQTRRKIADDIQQLLEYRHSDFDSDVMGQETEFARESCYAERKQVSTGRLDSMWTNFVTSLKTESRFINNAVNFTTDGIFRGGGDNARQREGAGDHGGRSRYSNSVPIPCPLES